MAISLYDLSVPTFLQTTRALSHCLDRAARHCAATGANPDEFSRASLFPDMAPFQFQIEAVKNHAVWGVKAVMTGVFDTPPLVWATSFADLRAMVSEAVTALEAFTPEEINSRSGEDIEIEIHQPIDEENHTTSKWVPRTLAFTPETFLLSYTLPNFYFHAVTAYDILRTRGVPLGKFDYQGRLRTRTA